MSVQFGRLPFRAKRTCRRAASRRIDLAAEGRFGDDTPPQTAVSISCLLITWVPVAYKMNKQIEHLWLDMDGLSATGKLSSGRV